MAGRSPVFQFDLLKDQWPAFPRFKAVVLIAATIAFNDEELKRAGEKIAELGAEYILDLSMQDDYSVNWGHRFDYEPFFPGYKQISQIWIPDSFSWVKLRYYLSHDTYWFSGTFTVLEKSR